MGEIGIVHDASNLRKLVAENPDLPIVVLAGEEANSGDYSWMYCTDVDCKLDFVLDCNTPYDQETVFTDKDEFTQTVSDSIWNEETKKLSFEEYEKLVEKEVSKYEKYWRKVIAIYATN